MKLYSIPETAERFGVSRDKVYRMLAAGELHAVKTGKYARISETEIERAIASFPAAVYSTGRSAV
jgi:excisionase family DNA binding protein